ncbi:MAG TPA: hypothetical protein PKO06_11635, partial [Candidatus Ozemobacteraceae bacterium]|nr:hypothetical protein [Candidatus Ozemobacteraceae bacterium]
HNRTESLLLLGMAVRAYSFARSMIKVFDRIPSYATDGTFIPILTSTFTPPPPPDPIVPEPVSEATASVQLPPLVIEPHEPPVIVDPKPPQRHLPKSLTLVAEADAARVRAFYTLNQGTHFEYAPDDREFKPVTARFLPGNHVVILDAGHRRVIVVDTMGSIIEEADLFADADGIALPLKQPSSLAVVDGPSILVADTGNHRVLELDQQLQCLWTFGGDTDEASSPFHLPLAAERLMNGHTLVIDGEKKDVVELTSSGAVVKRFGLDAGVADPICLFRRAGETRFWIGETTGRISCFEESGQIVRTIARVKTQKRGNDPFGGVGEEALSGLQALHADPDGNLLAVRRAAGIVTFLHRGETIWDSIKDLQSPSSVDMGLYTPPPDVPEEYLQLPPEKMVLVEPPDEEEDTEEFDPWYEERRLQEEENARLEEEAQRRAAARQVDVKVTMALAERRPRPVLREPSRTVDISGTMIFYPFAATIGDFAIPEPHYGAYQAGKGPRSHGIYVDRPHIRCEDLFFRAYGAMVRNKIFETYDHPPAYKIDQRHSSTPFGLRDAWYHGWDTFFSYAVRNSPTMPNLKTSDRKELSPLQLLETYAGQVTLEDETGEYKWLDELKSKAGRGLNCELAWSLIMWKLFESYGDLFLTNLRSYALNAVTPKYMPVSVMAELFADRLSDFLALGLVPVIRLETPDSSIPTLTNAAPRISWHANGLLGDDADKQLKFTLLYADNIDFLNAREIPIPEGKLLEFDFGAVLSEADQAAKLNNRLGNGVWYFRVRCDSDAFPNVGAKYGASSGIGAFRIARPTTPVDAAGGVVNFEGGQGVTGNVTIPTGATGKPLQVSAQPISVATGTNSDDVVGNAAIDFGPEGTKFNQVAEMNFRFDEKLLGGISPNTLVVKRWDAQKNQWIPIRTRVDPDKQSVQAKSGSFSVYALMIDKTPPQITLLTDSPDPLGRNATDASLITMQASENGLATLAILDSTGKTVRTLLNQFEFSNNACRTLWDLTDDTGRRVPDGT